jgi:hypothetical protein
VDALCVGCDAPQFRDRRRSWRNDDDERRINSGLSRIQPVPVPRKTSNIPFTCCHPKVPKGDCVSDIVDTLWLLIEHRASHLSPGKTRVRLEEDRNHRIDALSAHSLLLIAKSTLFPKTQVHSADEFAVKRIVCTPATCCKKLLAFPRLCVTCALRVASVDWEMDMTEMHMVGKSLNVIDSPTTADVIVFFDGGTTLHFSLPSLC